MFAGACDGPFARALAIAFAETVCLLPGFRLSGACVGPFARALAIAFDVTVCLLPGLRLGGACVGAAGFGFFDANRPLLG